MVYKAIKRNRTRSNYECLSAGAAQTFNVADFYVNGAKEKSPQSRKTQYRRYNSVGEFSFQFEDTKVDDDEFKLGGGQKQMVRSRRHRRMFSCLSGVA